MLNVLKGTSVQASIEGTMVTTQTVNPGKGFVGFGVGGFYPALFDDFSVTAGRPCMSAMG